MGHSLRTRGDSDNEGYLLGERFRQSKIDEHSDTGFISLREQQPCVYVLDNLPTSLWHVSLHNH